MADKRASTVNSLYGMNDYRSGSFALREKTGLSSNPKTCDCLALGTPVRCVFGHLTPVLSPPGSAPNRLMLWNKRPGKWSTGFKI